jgi:hypothetical protein
VPNNMLNVSYSFRPRDMHVSNGETTTTSAVIEDMRVRCRRITAFSVSTRPRASCTKSVPISVFSFHPVGGAVTRPHGVGGLGVLTLSHYYNI